MWLSIRRRIIVSGPLQGFVHVLWCFITQLHKSIIKMLIFQIQKQISKLFSCQTSFFFGCLCDIYNIDFLAKTALQIDGDFCMIVCIIENKYIELIVFQWNFWSSILNVTLIFLNCECVQVKHSILNIHYYQNVHTPLQFSSRMQFPYI